MSYVEANLSSAETIDSTLIPPFFLQTSHLDTKYLISKYCLLLKKLPGSTP